AADSGSAGRGRLSVYLKFPSSAVRWVVFCHTPERSLCLLRGVLSEPGFTSGTQPSLWGLYRLAAAAGSIQSRNVLEAGAERIHGTDAPRSGPRADGPVRRGSALRQL